MSEEYGEKTDKSLAGGPKQNRGCTDILCFIIFALFVTSCVYIAVFAIENGDPAKLAVPYDPDHKPCGEGDLADYPFIYFVNPTPTTLYQTVCVAECPTQKSSALDCATNSVVTSCEPKLTTADPTQRRIIYDSKGYGGIICMPQVQTYFQQISKALDVSQVTTAMNDLKNTRVMIAVSALVAIIVGFLFLRLIRISAGCVVWSAIILFIAGLLLATYKSYQSYLGLSLAEKSPELRERVEGSTLTSQQYYYLFITCGVLSIFTLLCTLCMCSRIKLCIAIVKCSARFVADTSSVLIVPVIFFVITLTFVAYWIYVSANLLSVGEISKKPKSLPFGQFSYTQEVKYFGYAHLFEFLWVNAFLVASCQFVIIGAVAFWYYQRGDASNTSKSIGLYLRYHIGTVAFGSLIIAIIEVLRIILEYIDQQVKQAGGDNNDVIKFVIKCCRCYLMCFERFIKFLNKNAYVQTVMKGSSFFPASKDAFFLLLRNPIRIPLVAGFGELFEFLGNICIAAGTTLISYLVLTNTEYYQTRVSSAMYPCIAVGIIAFTVGSFFMSLFGTAADCIIILFCMDEEMHTKAQFEPEELKAFRKENGQGDDD